MILNRYNTILRGSAGGGGFVPEYQAVYDYWTVKPSDSVASEQNIMVEGWVNSGFWDEEDYIHVPAIHTNANGEAQINWKNPGTYDLVLVANGGTMTHTALEGFQSLNGSYFRVDGYNPGDGVGTYKFTQDSCAFGAYCRTNINEVVWDIGVRDGGAWTAIALRLVDNVVLRLNDLTSDDDTLSTKDSSGMFIAYRENANKKQVDRNKLQIINKTTASTALPNGEWFFHALNRVGIGPSTLSTKQFSLGFSGGFINQTTRDDATDKFEAYMDSNSKGVIT